ncbi:MAG: protein kinase, partial [Polyangiales bacterium]
MGDPDVGPTDPTVFAGEGRASTPHAAPTIVADRYEILGLLGTGGMGRVYRALDRELRETVALKMLNRDFVGSAEMVERFRQEVRLARRVTHRNVARTFDIGEHGGEKFLTMELVEGESLSMRVGRGLLPLAETIAIAREIVAGMGAAHAVGVVHRDLKPDNVL